MEVGRLRRRSEFRRVYAQGVKVVGSCLVVFLLEREGTEARVGLTATRRVGSAVVRNRARRRVRELVRRNPDALPAGDLVVNLRRTCAEVPWPALEEDFVRCLGKLRRKVASRAS